MNTYLSFTLWFLAAEAVLTVCQLPLRRKTVKKRTAVFFTVLKILIAVGLAALAMVGPVALRIAQPFMMAMYVALFADGLGDIIYGIIRALSKKERRFGAKKAFGLVLGALYFVFGVVNMQIVTPKYLTYTSDKLRNEYKIAFVADLHVGSAQTMSVTEKTIEQIKAESPDFVFIGGDVTDDYTTNEEMEATARLFGGIGCPVYYIYGNHDRQHYAEQYANGRKYTEEEFEKAFTDAGITILQDEFAQLAPDLMLLGREDLSEKEKRADIKDLKAPSPDPYLIIVDHQPFAFDENTAVGADLQLCGHTHAGQLFPLGELCMPFAYCRGEHEYNGVKLYVSYGAAGWRVPLRTDACCHFEVITLKPASLK